MRTKALTSTSPYIIGANRLSKTLRQGRNKKEILHNVTFDVPLGSFTAITGPSGSGKSTLLRILGGLSSPSYGSVNVHGEDLYSKNDRVRSRFRNQTVGFVFQDYRLIPHYSALQNVMVPLKIAGLDNRKQKQRALQLLHLVSLDSFASQNVKNLSGGQQQRVGIARALAMNPKLLIADEPTGNLDSTTGESIIALLKSLQTQHGMTVVMVTHNDALAHLADQHIVLHDGSIQSIHRLPT